MSYKFEPQLKEIISSCKSDVNISDINESTDLVKDYSFDSISIIKLIVKVEDCLGIEIDDERLTLETLSPYDKLVELIAEYMNEK